MERKGRKRRGGNSVGKMAAAAVGRALRALRVGTMAAGTRSRSAGPSGAVTLPQVPLGADPHEEEPMAVAQRKVGGDCDERGGGAKGRGRGLRRRAWVSGRVAGRGRGLGRGGD